jgi:peptidoglycan/LPS O-acetylase OafA/YrhL
VVVCIPVALASYRLIESPPLRLRRRWFAGSTAPASGTELGGLAVEAGRSAR